MVLKYEIKFKRHITVRNSKYLYYLIKFDKLKEDYNNTTGG